MGRKQTHGGMRNKSINIHIKIELTHQYLEHADSGDFHGCELERLLRGCMRKPMFTILANQSLDMTI